MVQPSLDHLINFLPPNNPFDEQQWTNFKDEAEKLQSDLSKKERYFSNQADIVLTRIRQIESNITALDKHIKDVVPPKDNSNETSEYISKIIALREQWQAESVPLKKYATAADNTHKKVQSELMIVTEFCHHASVVCKTLSQRRIMIDYSRPG
jgi:hypothetical protein